MKRTFLSTFLCTLILGGSLLAFGSLKIHYAHAGTGGVGDYCESSDDCQSGLTCDTSADQCDIPDSTGNVGDYKLLVPLPIGANGRNVTSLPTATASSTALGIYVKGLYTLFIALAAVIAVVMIVYGGILYMSTDAIFNKSQGKAIIVRTLWGLLLIMGSYVILNTINPSLVSFSSSGLGGNAPVTAPANWCYKAYVNDTNNYLKVTCFQNNKTTCMQQQQALNGSSQGLTYTASCYKSPASGAWNTIQTCISVVAHSTLGGANVTMSDIFNGQPCFGNTYQGTDNSNYTAYINKLQCYQTSQACFQANPNGNCKNNACPLAPGQTVTPGGLNGVIDNGDGTGSFDIYITGQGDNKVSHAYTTNTSVTNACASKVSYWQSSSPVKTYVTQACYNQNPSSN